MGWGTTGRVVATVDAWGSESLWIARARFCGSVDGNVGAERVPEAVSRFRGNVRAVTEAPFTRDSRFRGNVSRAPGGWPRLVRERAPAYGVPEEEPSPDDETSAAATDSDRLLELADEIVILSAHLQAGTERLLELLAEFDRKGGWLVDGHRTCAHFHGKRCQAHTSPYTFDGRDIERPGRWRSLLRLSLGSFGHCSSSRSRWPHKCERVLRRT